MPDLLALMQAARAHQTWFLKQPCQYAAHASESDSGHALTHQLQDLVPTPHDQKHDQEPQPTPMTKIHKQNPKAAPYLQLSQQLAAHAIHHHHGAAAQEVGGTVAPLPAPPPRCGPPIEGLDQGQVVAGPPCPLRQPLLAANGGLPGPRLHWQYPWVPARPTPSLPFPLLLTLTRFLASLDPGLQGTGCLLTTGIDCLCR